MSVLAAVLRVAKRATSQTNPTAAPSCMATINSRKNTLQNPDVSDIASIRYRLKQSLPRRLAPSSRNHRLSLVRAILRFVWKRGLLASVPYVPMESVPEARAEWYTEEERDRLLDGMFRMQPRWYAFFYLTTRLGLRTGEVYAISKSRIRDIRAQLTVDRAVQRGTKERPALLGPRKSNKALTLALTPDVVDAIRWHIRQGYAGEEFLFSRDGTFPVHLDSHKRPLRTVQRALGLRELSHHHIGRHSVASQAATGGQSIKAIQAQLGAEHGGLSPPRSPGAAPISRGVAARCAPSRQRQVNEVRSPRSVAPQALEMISRGDWIRTSDLMLPKHAHYQAVLHPEAKSISFELGRSW